MLLCSERSRDFLVPFCNISEPFSKTTEFRLFQTERVLNLTKMPESSPKG